MVGGRRLAVVSGPNYYRGPNYYSGSSVCTFSGKLAVVGGRNLLW